MMKNLFLFCLLSIVLSGCLAKSVDVETNSKNIAINGENISKAFDLIGTYHKNDKTDELNAKMKEIAKNQFEESIKSKGLTVTEGLTTGIKTAGSLTEMAGIPYGGIAADILIGLLGLFGGKKVMDIRLAQASARRKEEEDWKKYLASLSPEEAEKAIKANGV